MKKHDQNKSYSAESARMTTPVVRTESSPFVAQEQTKRPVKKKKGKKQFHVYVAILMVWLIAVTCAHRL